MTIYSLIETAKANGHNPYKYLEFVFEARPNEKMSDEEMEALVRLLKKYVKMIQSKMLEALR